MKREKLTVKKNKKLYSGEIVWPSDLAEAVYLLGELEVWESFRVGYLALAKKRIAGLTPRRQRWAKIDLSSLDDQTRALIQALAREQQNKPLPQEASHTPQQAQESPPRVEQQTVQNDYAETQEEALTSTQSNDESFEQDLARYLASLGSLPQSQTVEPSGRLGSNEDLRLLRHLESL